LNEGVPPALSDVASTDLRNTPEAFSGTLSSPITRVYIIGVFGPYYEIIVLLADRQMYFCRVEDRADFLTLWAPSSFSLAEFRFVGTLPPYGYETLQKESRNVTQ